jgi:hypothetical protein
MNRCKKVLKRSKTVLTVDGHNVPVQPGIGVTPMKIFEVGEFGRRRFASKGIIDAVLKI